MATANHKVQAIPRRLLNPRRPNRKTTAEEAEEQLLQYDALLPEDPRRVLSHLYEVCNKLDPTARSFPVLIPGTGCQCETDRYVACAPGVDIVGVSVWGGHVLDARRAVEDV